MGLIYDLLHRKKDRKLRNDTRYINLETLGYSKSDIDTEDFGLTFEKELDGYFCHIYLTQQKIVLTSFFELSDDLFKQKFQIIERLFDKYAWAGRNYLEDRISFKSLSTAEIDKKMKELISVLKTENFPPMPKDTIINLKKAELLKAK
jgi:hypothetical protein